MAFAIAVAGNEGEFIARMNREAKRLGMDDTQFLNPTGLSQQGHYSTAHDLAVLSPHCCATFRNTPGSTPRRASRMAALPRKTVTGCCFSTRRSMA